MCNYNEILKIERKKHKLTQKDVAQKIGVQKDTYRRYEYGDRQPDFDTILRLADIYNVSTDYLLGRYIIKNAEQ